MRLPDCDCPLELARLRRFPYFQQTVQSNEQMYLWREALLFVCHTWGAEEGLAETRQNKQIASTAETQANTFSEPLSEKKKLSTDKVVSQNCSRRSFETAAVSMPGLMWRCKGYPMKPERKRLEVAHKITRCSFDIIVSYKHIDIYIQTNR